MVHPALANLSPEHQALIGQMLKDPEAAKKAIKKRLAEVSLLGFIKLTWHVLEPVTELKLGKVIEVICKHAEAILDSQRSGASIEDSLRRLLVNVPPGTMKSMIWNVFLPAYAWGPKKMPHLRFLHGSYALSLAKRDNAKFRTLITSEIYQENWGDVFKSGIDFSGKDKIDNDKTGFKQAFSTDGAITGDRADIIILDDPHNLTAAESEADRNKKLDCFTEALPSRTNTEHTAIVVVMQRVHHLDVSGHILKQPNKMGYQHLCLPMEYEKGRHCTTNIGFSDWRTEEGELLFPELHTRARVEELKVAFRSKGGIYAEAGQLQQRPVPRGGGMFKRKDLKIIRCIPDSARITDCVRGWDIAAAESRKADYTACARLSRDSEGNIYIEEVQKFQAGPGELEKRFDQTLYRDGYDVDLALPQDPGAAGKHFATQLGRRAQGHNVKIIPITKNKIRYAEPLAAQSEIGNVFVIEGDWNDIFLAELELFPNGGNDDQVDACTICYTYMTKGFKRPVATKGIFIEGIG